MYIHNPTIPHETVALLKQAAHLRKSWQADAAIQLLEDALDIKLHRPHTASILTALGDCYRLGKNDYSKALECYETCLQTLPNNLFALNGAGACEIFFGHIEKARARFEKVLLTDPNNSVALKKIRNIEYPIRFDPSEGMTPRNMIVPVTGAEDTIDQQIQSDAIIAPFFGSRNGIPARYDRMATRQVHSITIISEPRGQRPTNIQAATQTPFTASAAVQPVMLPTPMKSPPRPPMNGTPAERLAATIKGLIDHLNTAPKDIGTRSTLMGLFKRAGDINSARTQAELILAQDLRNASARMFLDQNPDGTNIEHAHDIPVQQAQQSIVMPPPAEPPASAVSKTFKAATTSHLITSALPALFDQPTHPETGEELVPVDHVEITLSVNGIPHKIQFLVPTSDKPIRLEFRGTHGNNGQKNFIIGRKKSCDGPAP